MHNAGIDGPYIYELPKSINFNNNEVAGIVLVDSVMENYYLIYPFDTTEVFFDDIGWKYCHLMTALGVARLFGETSLSGPLRLSTSQRGRFPLTESLYQADLANRNRTHYCRAVGNEEFANRKDETISTPPHSLGDLPLIVLTAGTDPTWAKIQDELASLSTNSSHILVENGPLYPQFFQPEAVIDAVEKMVDIVRKPHQAFTEEHFN